MSVAVLGLCTVAVVVGERGRSAWPILAGLLAVLLAVTTMLGYARALPLQNALMIGFAGGALGFILELIFTNTGTAWGRLRYGDGLGVQIFHDVPWLLPLIWIAWLGQSRALARVCLRPWRRHPRYGYWLLGLTSLLVIALDFGAEWAAAARPGLWSWETIERTLCWQSIPVLHFLAVGVGAAAIQSFTMAWQVQKQAVMQPVELTSLYLWGGMMTVATIACAASGQWLPAAMLLGVLAAVAVLAFRGVRIVLLPPENRWESRTPAPKASDPAGI